MKKYCIVIDDALSSIYEEIAKTCNKSTEEILQDTLFKVIALINKEISRENEP